MILTPVGADCEPELTREIFVTLTVARTLIRVGDGRPFGLPLSTLIHCIAEVEAEMGIDTSLKRQRRESMEYRINDNWESDE